MAPEIFENQSNKLFISDIWAMGVVFYKLCSGKYPFKHKKDNGKLITNFEMNIFDCLDLKIRELIKNMLNKDIDKRLDCF